MASFFILLIRLLGYFNNIKGGAYRCFRSSQKPYLFPQGNEIGEGRDLENNDFPPRPSDRVDSHDCAERLSSWKLLKLYATLHMLGWGQIETAHLRIK
jgi:hypothetical protein